MFITEKNGTLLRAQKTALRSISKQQQKKEENLLIEKPIVGERCSDLCILSTEA